MVWLMIGSINSIYDNTFKKYIYYQYNVGPHIWTLVKLDEKTKKCGEWWCGWKENW